MSTRSKLILCLCGILTVSAALVSLFIFEKSPNNALPVVAIANYGPHASLEETLRGIRDGLAQEGFKESHHITLRISDVNFDASLIPQMISKLKTMTPRVMVALTTPVAQVLKNNSLKVPKVFSAITDPVAAGLLETEYTSYQGMTGVSDRQDLSVFLRFVKKLLPNAHTIGILYATGEANDLALVKMIEDAASKENMKVIAVGVDHPRDIPLRMTAFKGKVDFIYVGLSGPIQPALPTIVASADEMNIPVFNADSDAVKNHLVLGSCGVMPYQVGIRTGQIIARLLRGEAPEAIPPFYPSQADHKGFVSQKRAERYGIFQVEKLQDVTCVV